MKDFRKHEATPAQRGTVAFHAGLDQADNPYPVGSPEAAEWAERYQAAKRAYELGKLRPEGDLR